MRMDPNIWVLGPNIYRKWQISGKRRWKDFFIRIGEFPWKKFLEALLIMILIQSPWSSATTWRTCCATLQKLMLRIFSSSSVLIEAKGTFSWHFNPTKRLTHLARSLCTRKTGGGEAMACVLKIRPPLVWTIWSYWLPLQPKVRIIWICKYSLTRPSWERCASNFVVI